FFSSRRRHTRSYGDWSSDVCSSDLEALVAQCGKEQRQFEGSNLLPGPPQERAVTLVENVAIVEQRLAQQRNAVIGDRRGNNRERSEERRVGKECRSGGEQSQEKKKR